MSSLLCINLEEHGISEHQTYINGQSCLLSLARVYTRVDCYKLRNGLRSASILLSFALCSAVSRIFFAQIAIISSVAASDISWTNGVSIRIGAPIDTRSDA